MNKIFFPLCCCLFLLACKATKQAQTNPTKTTYRFAFYNVENLFDTVDTSDKFDEDFTPTGKLKWTTERYQKKLYHISKVVQGMEFPSILGFCEVENEAVLKDLTQTDLLKNFGYQVVHHESPDRRGIDNGLIYKAKEFEVLASDHYQIDFPKEVVEDYTTRDILYVKGIFLGKDTLHIFVNHWPSRRGGLKASEPKRVFVASQLKEKTSAILQKNAQAKIVIMGDFNDETDNNSLMNTLGAKTNSEVISPSNLYNCSAKLDQAGDGTYNYRGNWNMLDQFIVSGSMLNPSSNIQALPVHIYKADWLNYNDPKYGPKPSRTYGGPNYYGGYSDHYPIFMDVKIQ